MDEARPAWLRAMFGFVDLVKVAVSQLSRSVIVFRADFPEAKERAH